VTDGPRGGWAGLEPAGWRWTGAAGFFRLLTCIKIQVIIALTLRIRLCGSATAFFQIRFEWCFRTESIFRVKILNCGSGFSAP
jgi:hypothetical protein